MRILGVTIGHDLSATGHFYDILEACSGSLHGLCITPAQGLPPMAQHVVTEAPNCLIYMLHQPGGPLRPLQTAVDSNSSLIRQYAWDICHPTQRLLTVS